jgi:hypothetical protein
MSLGKSRWQGRRGSRCNRIQDTRIGDDQMPELPLRSLR